jgi:hypothetical protein
MQRAPLRDDVAGGPARDDADVRAREVVDPAETEIRDGAGGRLDRRTTLLRSDTRMGRPAVEAHLERARGRRSEHDLADRRRMVVDESETRIEPRRVERARAHETHFLFRREDELDAGMREPFGDDPSRALEHRRDGRLVVAAQDRAGGVPDDPVLDDRLDRRLRRHRVEVSAEEDGCPALHAARQSAEDVPGVRPDHGPRRVLVPGEAELAQVGADAIGDAPFPPRRARHRSKLEEQVEDGHGHRCDDLRRAAREDVFAARSLRRCGLHAG